MKTLRNFATILLVTFCITSCWAPEKFTATLHVKEDKTFTFAYEGTIAFGPALGEIKQRGQLSAEAEAEMKSGEAELRKEPEFKKVKYAGNGRFAVAYEETGTIQNGKEIFLELLEFRIAPDGQIWVVGVDIPAENRRQLAEVDLGLDGTLKVTSDLPVSQHNATSTPKLGGLFGAYEWKITLQQKDQPAIAFTPKPQESNAPKKPPQDTLSNTFGISDDEMRRRHTLNESTATVKISDSEITELVIGEWNTPRHSYVFRSDGTWQMLNGTTHGTWHVKDGTFNQGKNAYRVLSVNKNDLFLENIHGKHPFHYERASN